MPRAVTEGSKANLLELAVELAPTGMLAIDNHGLILLANREVERLFGYSRSELIGEPVETLVPARFRDDHPVHRLRYAAEPSERPVGVGRELCGLRKDGTEVPIEIGLTPMQTEAGLFVLATIVDVTARRAIEGHVIQAQKLEAIGTLAGGIAHDFNNLLLAIIGYTELAANALESNAAVRADLAQVLQSAERGRKLVKRLLTFSRNSEIPRQPLELSKTVGEGWALLRASLPSTIEMRASFDAATPCVLSDETQIQQVLMNLVTNAAHAMPEGGVIEARLRPVRIDADRVQRHPGLCEGLYALLSVNDDGCGMDEEVRRRAFEPFFTTRAPSQGTGLGLSVVHGIVREHDGFVELESEPGRGTRVDVYLRACDEDRVVVSDSTRARAARSIMVVEDEERLADMIGRQLGRLGYEMTVCTSSLEALSRFTAEPRRFDLVVTDNTMPDLTGIALADELLRVRPELPILLVSGGAETAKPEALLKSGIRAVLPKPYTIGELQREVAELIGPATDEARVVSEAT